MDPKYKTIIPLIVVFFVFGVAIGYVAHKPETIEKIVTVTVTPVPTPSPTLTTPIPPPIPTPTPTATATPTIPDFTARNYDKSTDKPTRTIDLVNRRANPDDLSIYPGDTVLIQITEYTLQTPLRLTITSLNMSQERTLTYGGASAYITFNNKGTYSFKAIAPPSDPNIQTWTYAEGRIVVY